MKPITNEELAKKIDTLTTTVDSLGAQMKVFQDLYAKFTFGERIVTWVLKSTFRMLVFVGSASLALFSAWATYKGLKNN